MTQPNPLQITHQAESETQIDKAQVDIRIPQNKFARGSATQPDLHSFRHEELPVMNKIPQTKDEYRDLRQHYKIISKNQGIDGVMNEEHSKE